MLFMRGIIIFLLFFNFNIFVGKISPRSDEELSPRSDEELSPRSDEELSPRSDEEFLSPRYDE